MSDKLKEVLGEELYSQITEKLGDKKIDFLDGYVPKARLDQEIEKKKVNEEKVLSYEKQLGEVKKSLQDNEEFKNKYAELETRFSAEIKSKDTELENVKKRFLVKEALVTAGGKHPNLLIKEIDFSKISVENDKVIGINDLIDDLKANYNDLFIEKVNTSTNTDTKKTKTTTNDGDNWDEIIKQYTR